MRYHRQAPKNLIISKLKKGIHVSEEKLHPVHPGEVLLEEFPFDREIKTQAAAM